MIVEHDLAKQWRVMSFGEFEDLYLSIEKDKSNLHQKTLGVLCNPLYGFTPVTRPAFVRLLLAKTIIYSAIVEFGKRRDVTAQETMSFLESHEPEGFRSWGECFDQNSRSFFEDPSDSLTVARQLVERVVFPRLKSIEKSRPEIVRP